MRRTSLLLAGLLLGGSVLAGCGGGSDPAAEPATGSSSTATDAATGTSSPTPTPTPTPTPSSSPPATGSASPTKRPLGTYPPAWLGTRVLPRTPQGYGEIRPTPPELRNRRFTLPDTVPMLPGKGFASRVISPPPQEVLARSTWQRGCPVGADDLAWVRVTFHGFDGRRHTGELLVHRRVADDLVRVMRRLYELRYPIEEMRITRRDELDAPPTGDGNNTGVFNCRPTTGGTSYSQHAYGLAIDLNPFHNPYEKGDVVLPELAGAYLDRSRRAPGIIHADDPVVRAFADIGWGWGGAWRSLKDYQHFSENGR